MYSEVVNFTAWYFRNNRPIKPPADMTIFRTDNASSACVYRQGRFQVELYLIDIDAPIPNHGHPGVDAVEINNFRLADMDVDHEVFLDELEQLALYTGQWHGASIEERAKHNGHYLTSVQYWHPDIPMKTISTRWIGPTVGPVHDALIKLHNPTSYSVPGYADVTLIGKDFEVL